MNTRISIALMTMLGCAAVMFAQNPGDSSSIGSQPASRPAWSRVTPRLFQRAASGASVSPTSSTANASTSNAHLDIKTEFLNVPGLLPMWKYTLKAPFDGHQYIGGGVGYSPFEKPGTTKINTYIIPLVIRTHRIANSIDSSTFQMSTVPGDLTIDPRAADNTCMAAPNNVPLTVVQQSPLFTPTKFLFGGVDVGTTQYLDANERASFWNALGTKRDDYHVLLDPVNVTTPIVLDVPENQGLAITDPQVFSALGFSFCAPLQLVDANWFESYLQGTIVPHLSEVNPASLPIFLAYNGFWAFGVDNLLNCCYTGFPELVAGKPVPTQLYVYATFDRTGFMAGPSAGLDLLPLSQLLGTWVSDPYEDNFSPVWCPFFYDVTAAGYPLMGIARPPITMPNGYTYYLQELTFFSWFFGGRSLGVNGWYSNNGSLLTPAGPCP